MTTKILYGDRVGREGKIRLGCAALLFNENRTKILLTRRVDNGQWCLPSGGTEPGESVTETCERETWEETGLKVRVKRLIGVFSSPNRLVIYDNGGKFQIITLSFEVELAGGAIKLSDETTDIGYYPLAEIEKMDVLPHHKQFIADVLMGQDAAFIR